jgi:hypothetical protein
MISQHPWFFARKNAPICTPVGFSSLLYYQKWPHWKYPSDLLQKTETGSIGKGTGKLLKSPRYESILDDTFISLHFLVITMIQLIKPFWLRIAPQSQFKIQSVQGFCYALSLPKTPTTSLTRFMVSSSLTASYTGSLRTPIKKGSITKLQTLEVAVLLLLVKRKIPSFTSPHRWEYSDLPSYTGWSNLLAHHLAWWIQLENRFLGLDTNAEKIKKFKSSKYCHLKHSTNSFLAF